jgi:hypothetical protein
LTSGSGPGDGLGPPGGHRWPEPERTLEAGIDYDHANAARIYDYFLGGAHNFAVDREAAAWVARGNPEIVAGARANRGYLGRVVRWCQDQGIDQFLDLGSGVPTVGNVHEIAHQVDSAVRVAYVDYEPVAVAHAESLLTDEPSVTITRADLRDPQSVLDAPGVAGLLDLSRPVALLAVAVLHFVPDPVAADALGAYRAVLAPGSVIAISHASDDQDDPDLAGRVRDGTAAYNAHASSPMTLRSRAELRALLSGLDVVEPGVVDVRDWPDLNPDQPGDGTYYAAVARRVDR